MLRDYKQQKALLDCGKQTACLLYEKGLPVGKLKNSNSSFAELQTYIFQPTGCDQIELLWPVGRRTVCGSKSCR